MIPTENSLSEYDNNPKVTTTVANDQQYKLKLSSRARSAGSHPANIAMRNAMLQERTAPEIIVNDSNTNVQSHQSHSDSIVVHNVANSFQSPAINMSFPSPSCANQDQGMVRNSVRMLDEPIEFNVTADNLIRNLFYLENEQPQRRVYGNNVGKVIHKAMHYKCVDGNGPNKRVQVDLIDIVEKQADKSQKQPKNAQAMKQRSLIYFTTQAIGCETGADAAQDDNTVREAASQQTFHSFEDMYNIVTERLVARVLSNERQRQEQVAHESEIVQASLPQSFLLIGENDTNLVQTRALAEPEIISKTSQPVNKQVAGKKQQPPRKASAGLHDRLYRESVAK